MVHLRRRLVSGWEEVDPGFNYGDMRDVLEKAKMEPLVEFDPSAGTILRWHEGVYKTFSKDDYLGQEFSPFGGNNYLYGFPLSKLVLSTYRVMWDPKHKGYDAFQKQKAQVYRGMTERGLDHNNIFDINLYVHATEDITIGLLKACEKGSMTFPHRVALLHGYMKVMQDFLEKANDEAYWKFPLYLGVQVIAVGFKRTLWLWGLGILASEGVSASMKGQYAGWSLISFMIFGQCLEEVWEDKKLPFRISGTSGLATTVGGAWGLYQVVSTYLEDPGGFLKAGPKTGVHHGVHQIGMVAGALVNRFTR